MPPSFRIRRDLIHPHQGSSPEKFLNIVRVSVPRPIHHRSRQAIGNEIIELLPSAADISGDGFRALQDFGGFNRRQFTTSHSSSPAALARLLFRFEFAAVAVAPAAPVAVAVDRRDA